MDLQKWETASKIIAAIFIPVAVAYMANQISFANKKIETEAKLVEVATGILSREPQKNQTVEQRELRRWAVAVVNRYSGIPMTQQVEDALVDRITLPSDRIADSGGPWGVIFGGDKTLDEAKWEIQGAEKKAGVAGGQIFLRSGSYRSIVVLQTKADAEETLGKLRSYRASSYVVDMGKWCPNSVQQSGYLECKI